MSTTSRAGSAGALPDRATGQLPRVVATYLTGRNVLLMAADWARCRELSSGSATT